MNYEKLIIAIIASRFNEEIVDNLIFGAVEALKSKGVKEENIHKISVPGAFEIPVMLKKLCRENIFRKKYDGILTLGCIIKGETAHFEYISSAVSNSISNISYEYEVPTGFGVLTCYTEKQAQERSSKKSPDKDNNKGFESALALLDMIELLK